MIVNTVLNFRKLESRGRPLHRLCSLAAALTPYIPYLFRRSSANDGSRNADGPDVSGWNATCVLNCAISFELALSRLYPCSMMFENVDAGVGIVKRCASCPSRRAEALGFWSPCRHATGGGGRG